MLISKCDLRKLSDFRSLLAATLLFAAIFLSGCGSDSGGSNGTNTPPNIPDPTKAVTLSITPSSSETLNFHFAANTVNVPATVTIASVGQNSLPVPITRVVHVSRAGRSFTPNTNNIYMIAFKIAVNPTSITTFNVPVALDGMGVTPTTIPANTILNIAYLQNEGQSNAQWTDVGTFKTGTGGAIVQNLPTTTLPGITQPGTYVIYEPAAGGTTLANFGLALLAADSGNLQVINLYDSAGNPLATPTLKTLAFSGSSDLDGQALTPDGSYGILVDGGNTVRFFSGVQTGVPIASTATVDISAYGGDGDSVAIMPNGDTAVVTGDSSTLVVISGIASGNPKLATTITCPDVRDGLVISNDGRTLLARGGSGLTIFAIAPTTPTTGSLGGTVSYTFTQVTDLPSLGSNNNIEDGREGMASSPADPSRATVIGTDNSGNPNITLITGLPNAPVTRSLPLRVPANRSTHRTASVIRPHRHKASRAVITGVNSLYAVAITPDGKQAVLGTDTGLVLVSGVDTGSLVQVGAAFNPAFTPAGSTTATNLNSVHTLAITLDGRYAVPVADSGTLLMYPVSTSGFGAQVAQLDGVAVPGNDQILLH